ncbi:MAG: histidine phosphatase family protein [Lactobacillaceae bacterium]|jgi:probable phosphoglycerate mutase|nr:histidine phosphatase family protein [Lactobacillaceae bacterium]
MTKLYFIRHGKTEWNQAGRFQGANGDSPLLATSYDQIEQLGKHLKAIKFTHAFASPITRAKITAEETIKYLDFKPALTLQPGLGEFGMGIWEGMEFHAVMAQWPAMYDAYRHHPDQFDASQIEGAETFANVQLRFRQAVEAAVSQYGGADVNLVFFSHGMALTAGMAGLLEIPLAQSRARGGLGNTSTSILETTDGIHYTELIRNDISYLTSANDASNTI